MTSDAREGIITIIEQMLKYTKAALMEHGTIKDTCNVVCVNKTLVARAKKALPQGREIGEAAAMFSVLGDPTRIKIIFSLSREKELCVCDIANILGLTVSAASHQLRKLRDARAVTYRNDGTMVYYSLADKYVQALLSDALGHVARNGR